MNSFASCCLQLKQLYLPIMQVNSNFFLNMEVMEQKVLPLLRSLEATQSDLQLRLECVQAASAADGAGGPMRAGA